LLLADLPSSPAGRATICPALTCIILAFVDWVPVFLWICDRSAFTIEFASDSIPTSATVAGVSVRVTGAISTARFALEANRTSTRRWRWRRRGITGPKSPVLASWIASGAAGAETLRACVLAPSTASTVHLSSATTCPTGCKGFAAIKRCAGDATATTAATAAV